jgi:hypothetical protein
LVEFALASNVVPVQKKKKASYVMDVIPRTTLTASSDSILPLNRSQRPGTVLLAAIRERGWLQSQRIIMVTMTVCMVIALCVTS